MAAVVLAVALAACGGDDGGDGAASTDPDPAADSNDATDSNDASGGDFCTDLEAVVDAGVELMTPLFGEDATSLQEVVDDASETYPDLAASAQASAPDQVAEDVATITDNTTELVEALAAVDVSDPEAVGAAFQDSALMSGELSEASTRVGDYAKAECGFDPADASTELEDSVLPQAAEAPDACSLVDPQIVADAGGVTLDVTDEDGGADVDLGAFATKSCSYGNGAMTISTVTFAGDVASIAQDYVDTAESNDGSVIDDVDLGDLPASTLITEVSGFRTITVFEAPTAFQVAFAEVDDPTVLVAAAEAVLAATA
jgi:hypothetical protein